jgi:outer membrane protein insertion porin family
MEDLVKPTTTSMGLAALLAGWVFLSGICWAQDAPPAVEETAEEEPTRVELEDPFKPRYILESIEVRGNHKTQGKLILSYVHLKPGESLDEEKVELSRIRLLALGYFKDVHMSLEKGSERGRVKLVVEVDERNTIIIDDLFGGFSKTNPFWGGIGVSDINFLGRGLVLSGAFVASEYQQAYRLGAFWPSVFNTNLQAGVEALVALGEERALASRVQGCDRDQNLEYLRAGGVLSLGMRVDRIHRINFELHGEHIEDTSDRGNWCDTYPNPHPFDGYLRSGQSTFWSLTFRFERDTRDDFFLATRGMHLVISIELASKIFFGSDYEFSKYMIKYEHSFPAFSDHAFRVSVVGGLIQDVGEQGSPFFKRFFVGDYAFFQVEKDSLPRNLELNFSEVVDYGDLMASVSAEYDIPLWSRGKFFYRGYVYAAANFSYVTKSDFLASENEWSGRTKKPVSMDIGMKVDTPIGLFTFSLGYVFDLIF